MLLFCNRTAARVIAGMSNTMIAMNTRSILFGFGALALGVFAVPVAQAQSPPSSPRPSPSPSATDPSPSHGPPSQTRRATTSTSATTTRPVGRAPSPASPARAPENASWTAPSNTYFVYVTGGGGGNMSTTASDNETLQPSGNGWSIANAAVYQQANWLDEPGSHAMKVELEASAR